MWNTGNADAECATFRETCIGTVGCTDYGERCDGMELNTDRRTLSESRVRENLMHGLMRGDWKHDWKAGNGLGMGNSQEIPCLVGAPVLHSTLHL